jgi:nucleoside-diphosphate-sugar epimerase
MNVLLTGADGFIGRHLARGLVDAGHSLVAAVFGREAGAGEVRVDLTDRAAVAALPRGIDLVINASGVVDQRVPSAGMFAVNLGGTQNLVHWARATSVRHFIQLSSVAVYGPLVLGEARSENTARLGRALGLPYMRSKAQAERVVERSGVPYSLLRPAAVLGAGDSVVAPGFVQALRGPGVPLVAGARPDRRVSLTLVAGLVDAVLRLTQRGPLHAAVHTIDAELPLQDLAEQFAAELGLPCNFARTAWREVWARSADAGFSWLVASARFGQHYSRERQNRLLGRGVAPELGAAIRAGISGLQGEVEALS